MDKDTEWDKLMQKTKTNEAMEVEMVGIMKKANETLDFVKIIQDVNTKLSAVIIELHNKAEFKEDIEILLKKYNLSINLDKN